MPEVEGFALGWHPQRGCAFRVKLIGNGWSQWTSVPSADLAALAAIFKERPVFVNPNGSITTGPEQPRSYI
jgi:hypothetical protein